MRSNVRTYSTKSFQSRKKPKTGWYAFTNVKLSKMLRFFSVAEAHGLIYPRPLGENFRLACLLYTFRTKNGKATGIDNVYNDILKKAIGTGFYTLLARAFTVSLKLGFIPYFWKVAVLCMLIKPDKPPSQTTSY